MMQYPQISIPPRSQHLWRYTPWKRIHPTKAAEMPESDPIRFSSGVDSEMNDSEEEAMGMIVNGFFEPFTRELPMEYAVELNRLLELEMEGAIG